MGYGNTTSWIKESGVPGLRISRSNPNNPFEYKTMDKKVVFNPCPEPPLEFGAPVTAAELHEAFPEHVAADVRIEVGDGWRRLAVGLPQWAL